MESLFKAQILALTSFIDASLPKKRMLEQFVSESSVLLSVPLLVRAYPGKLGHNTDPVVIPAKGLKDDLINRVSSLAWPQSSKEAVCFEGDLYCLSIGELGELYFLDPSGKISRDHLHDLRIVLKSLARQWTLMLESSVSLRHLKRYRRATDAAKIGVFEWDLDSRRCYISRPMARMLGVSDYRDIASIEQFLDIVHPEDRDRLVSSLKGYQQLHNQDPLDVQFRTARLDGDDRKLLAHVTKAWDPFNDTTVLTCATSDVTHLELIRSETLYRTQLEQLIVRLSMKMVNAPVETIKEVLNTALSETGRFLGVDRAYIMDYDWEHGSSFNTYEWCAEGIQPQIDELQDIPIGDLSVWITQHRNGLPMLVTSVDDLASDNPLKKILSPQGIKSLISIPLMIRGECFGFIGFDAVRSRHHWSEIDITLLQLLAELIANIEDRRRHETRMLETLDSLKQSAEAANLSSRIANAANQAKSRFVATVSHELRSPLHVILGNLDILRQTALSSDQATYLGAINTATMGLSRLIDDLLDFERLEFREVGLNPQTVDLRDLLEQLTSEVRNTAIAKGVDVHLNWDHALSGRYELDGLRFRQMIGNLLGNAVKFTERGSICVTARRANIDTSSGIETVRITVEDTGIGIPSGSEQQIFAPFYQADNVPFHARGTGLGLSIVKSIADMMGASVSCSSIPGRGTTFSVLLSLASASDLKLSPEPGTEGRGDGSDPVKALARKIPAGPDQEVPDLSGMRILIVEDDRLNQVLLRGYLRDTGCVLDFSDDGAQAITACQQAMPDLVLMDCRMPVMDGFEATRRIRALSGRFSTLPIVAVTANAMKGDRERCLQVGMNDFLAKPFTRRTLLTLVAKWQPENKAFQ